VKTAASTCKVELGEAGKIRSTMRESYGRGINRAVALKGLFIEWLCTRAVCGIGIKARSNSRWWEGSNRRESRWV
jgi:hypothetical protein